MKTKEEAIKRIQEIMKNGVKRNYCGSKSVSAYIEDAQINILMEFYGLTLDDL